MVVMKRLSVLFGQCPDGRPEPRKEKMSRFASFFQYAFYWTMESLRKSVKKENNMPRILAFDYGGKRTGIAVTDPLQMIATALGTVDTDVLIDYLKTYCAREEVETFVVGQPFR